MIDFIDNIDSETCAVYLLIASAQVVLLQNLIESYEGAGTVRTLDAESGLVAILTTPSMLAECSQILESIRAIIPWQAVPRPAQAVTQIIEGGW